MNTLYQKDDKIFDIQSFYSLIEHVNFKLEPTWQWIVNILDSTESKLRFGCASNSLNLESSVAQYLKGIEDRAISSNIKYNDGGNRRRTLSTFSGIHRGSGGGGGAAPIVQQQSILDQNNPRRDFMNYALSLMLMSSNEHKEMLPYIDLYNLKHVAYIFDGLMCYLRIPDLNNDDDNETNTDVTQPLASTSATPKPLINLYETEEIESETEMETCVSYQTDSASEEDESSKMSATMSSCTRTNTFFKRSDSTLCLGGSS